MKPKKLLTKDLSWDNIEDMTRRNRFKKMLKYLPYIKDGTGADIGSHFTSYKFIKENCGLKKLIQINVLRSHCVKEDLIIADVENGIPFKKNYFDFIFLGEILEHMNNLDFILEEVWRVLKPNGIALITTPNGANLYDRFMFLFGKLPQSYNISNKYFVDMPDGKTYKSTFEGHGHMKLFTIKALKELVELNGFQVLATDSYWNSEKDRPLHIFRWMSQFFPKGLQEGIIMKIKKVGRK